MIRKFFANIEELITGIALSIMCVLVILNVFIRLFFSKTIPWTEEIAYICYAYVIFVGASSLYKRFGHSAIDLIVRAFPVKLQAVCSIFSTVTLLITNIFCFVLSCGFCESSWTRKTQLLKIPYSLESFALVLAFGLMTIHSVMFLINIFKKKDYFHEVPIYKGIVNVDALEDQVQETLEHQKQKTEGGEV